MYKDDMTPKQRLLASIKGQDTDRAAWSPFLAYFWESMPQRVQDEGQLKFLEGLGADPLLRGSHQLFGVNRKRCRVNEKIHGTERIVTYETPVGELRSKHVYSPAGNTWFITDHPVKTEEDFKILMYLYEDLEITANYDKYLEDCDALGERGLYLPGIGVDIKTPFQSLVEHWVGTENLVYALADYPAAVEECLAVMGEKSIDSVNISVLSPAEAFIFWEDSSTTNISPSLFLKYTAPDINRWGRIIHDAGKYLVHHACGHIRALLPLMANTEIDVIESISPPPTGNIEIWEARDILPDNIGIIGGIEPTFFLNCNLDELRPYVENLLDKMGKHRYILANSDSCPPGVAIEKLRLVTDIVKSRACFK